MSQLLDPNERAASGIAMQGVATGKPASAPRTPWEESVRDFVFGEVWSRPKLDLRSRFLIGMSGAAITGAPSETLDGYVRGALKSQSLTQLELREACLHLAVYGGWSRGGSLDASVSRVCKELDLAPEHAAPLRTDAWDPEVRNAQGAEEFKHVMTFSSGPPITPYLQGMHNFVFAEMWLRRALDQRARRWVTLVGVCESATEIPIKSHIHAAMASGNCTADEMHEFALQYGVHAGWPKASIVQWEVVVMAQKIAKGLPWHG